MKALVSVRMVMLFMGMGLLGCYSCTKKKPATVVPLIQPDFTAKPSVQLSDLASDVQYVPLDDSVMLGNISHVKSAGNRIFLEAQGGILQVFNDKGKYEYPLKKMGRGPQEVNGIYDFSVDGQSNRLAILDLKKVAIYNLNGKFIRDIPLPDNELIQKIDLKGDHLFLFQSAVMRRGKYSWLVLDTLGNRVGDKLNFMSSFQPKRVVFPRLFFTDQNQLYYWNCLNDTIFDLKAKSYQPAFRFAPGAERATKEDFMQADLSKQTNSFILRSVFKSGNDLFLDYLNFAPNVEEVVGMFDMKNRTWHMVSRYDLKAQLSGIPNDWDGGMPFMPIKPK